MQLYHALQHKLSTVHIDEFTATLGYENIRIGRKTIERFLYGRTIYACIAYGLSDMEYDSTAFVKVLAETLSVDISKELKKVQQYLAGRSHYHCIFIETTFERSIEPLEILFDNASQREIKIDKEMFMCKKDEEVLKHVGEIVKNHHIEHNGFLMFWGYISQYIYEHHDQKIYLFDIDGKCRRIEEIQGE